MAHMSNIARLRDAIPRHLLKLSKIETKILAILMETKSGNAYSVWKASKLKYYPTVLRTLKKLKERNFIRILSEDGSRGETIYTLTLVGSLIFYVSKDDEQGLFNFIYNNSRLFRELNKVEKDIRWMYGILREFFWNVRREENLSVDEAVKIYIDLSVGDNVLNIRHDPEARKLLVDLSKVDWIKPRIIERIESEIDESKRDLKALNEFKKVMITT